MELSKATKNAKPTRFARSPRKKTSTHSGACLKYHFCFAPIDMKHAKKVYFLIDHIFGEYDFASNVLNVKDGHYVYLYMDSDKLTHIDFNGEDWSAAETDVVFDRIRNALRANNIYFAFTNFKETPEKDS